MGQPAKLIDVKVLIFQLYNFQFLSMENSFLMIKKYIDQPINLSTNECQGHLIVNYFFSRSITVSDFLVSARQKTAQKPD